MKTKLKTIIPVLGFMAIVAMVIPTQAQDLSLWDLETDVDGDGMVGPTDIQHVVNSALGLNDQGENAINLPLRKYIVASPRAALALHPLLDATDEPVRCPAVGAVSNFPRRDSRMLVRQGTVIVFRYDRNVEGVWYDGACGLLRSNLEVEMRELRPPQGEGMGEGGDPASGDPTQRVNGVEVDGAGDEEVIWTPIGHDGAEARTCGPAIGTAQIAVRHHFQEPGDYLVRAHITTAAIPANASDVLEDSANFCGAVRRHDRVLVHVRVVAHDPTNADHSWHEEHRAETVPDRYGNPMRHELDPTVELPEGNVVESGITD
jgi:hypothetical protein